MKKLLFILTLTFLSLFEHVQAQVYTPPTSTAVGFEENHSGYDGAFKYIAYVWNGQMYTNLPCHSKKDNGDGTTTFTVYKYVIFEGRKEYSTVEYFVDNDKIKSVLEIVATNEKK